MLGGAARCRNHSAAGGMHRDRRRRVGAQGTIPVAESSISVVRLLKPAATRADTGGLGDGFSFHRCPGAMFHVKQHTRRRSQGVSGGRGTTLALDSDVIARHAQRGCQILGLPCQPGFANAMTLACVRPLRSTGSLLCVGTVRSVSPSPTTSERAGLMTTEVRPYARDACAESRTDWPSPRRHCSVLLFAREIRGVGRRAEVCVCLRRDEQADDGIRAEDR